MKLMKRKFGQWWNSNIYLKFLSRWSSGTRSTHGNFLSFCGQTRQRCFEIADSRLYKAEFHTKQCKQALRLLTSSSKFGRRPPTTARQDLPALQNANGVEANPRHTQDRSAIAASPSVGDESLWRRPERLAWADLHEITRGSHRTTLGGGFEQWLVV